MNGYLAMGLLWFLYNSTSNSYRRLAVRVNEKGRPWILLVGLVAGVLLWPIGLIITIALKAK